MTTPYEQAVLRAFQQSCREADEPEADTQRFYAYVQAALRTAAEDTERFKGSNVAGVGEYTLREAVQIVIARWRRNAELLLAGERLWARGYGAALVGCSGDMERLVAPVDYHCNSTGIQPNDDSPQV